MSSDRKASSASTSPVRRSKRMATSKSPYAKRSRLDEDGTAKISLKSPDDDDSSWDDLYQRLVEYQEQVGDCNVPVKYVNDARLGIWVQELRAAYAKGTLSDVQKQALDDLDFEWEVEEERYTARSKRQMAGYSKRKAEKWNVEYNKLQAHVQQHGNLQGLDSRSGLGGWVSLQKRRFREGKLKPESEQYAKLEQLGVWTTSESVGAASADAASASSALSGVQAEQRPNQGSQSSDQGSTEATATGGNASDASETAAPAERGRTCCIM